MSSPPYTEGIAQRITTDVKTSRHGPYGQPLGGLATLWKRFANAPMTAFRCVANRGPRTTSKQRRSTRFAVSAEGRRKGFMTNPDGEHSRIAYCECGAQLAGESRGQLFDAAQAHLAHHHPELLGALGLDLVQQMVEERPGAVIA